MLDRIVLGTIGWNVANAERQLQFICQPREAFAKERNTIAVATAAISDQQDRVSLTIAPLAQPIGTGNLTGGI